ncbi:MAG: hypothetical protein ACK5LM_03635 [Lactovum sp.]
MKKILFLFLSFYFPSLIVILMSIGNENVLTNLPSELTYPSLMMILSRNLMMLLIFTLSSFISNWISYFFFYFNAIYFSLALIISGDVIKNFFQVLKYGLIEVFAFAIACYLLSKKNYKKLYLPVFLILLAGIIEHFVIKGIL